MYFSLYGIKTGFCVCLLPENVNISKYSLLVPTVSFTSISIPFLENLVLSRTATYIGCCPYCRQSSRCIHLSCLFVFLFRISLHNKGHSCGQQQSPAIGLWGCTVGHWWAIEPAAKTLATNTSLIIIHAQ
jgi:hypothetical protein